MLPGVRRVVAAGLAPVVAMSQVLVPVSVTAAVAAAGSVAVAVTRPAAAHATGQSVLILSTSVNGGSSSAEALGVPSGDTVTVATPSTWDAMTTAQFAAYSAIVIGDPSTSSACALSAPADAVSTAATWGAAVTGNVAVAGTAPVFAGGAGTSLIKDSIAYALAGSGTGLYVSLNCEYQSSAAGTAVPLLAGVNGGGFTVTGQGPGCPNSGTINTAEGRGVTQFSGLFSGALSWASPACSVQETLNSWPSQFTGLAYYAGATPADFTASDGATGQPYVLLGAPVSAATQALAPTTGGEVPAGATAGGGSNPAAPGVSQATAGDPVNTENGDFTQSASDVSAPTYGPALGFDRSYDANLAQQQTRVGAPGAMGYGWTDNWGSSLSTSRPVPADIYTLDGLATDTGAGGPPANAAINHPDAVDHTSTGTYIADTNANRIEEIPAASGTQWGQPMTAGNIYTIAGSDTGEQGDSLDGTPAASALLFDPEGVTVDQAGNLFIADTGNNRVVEIPAASGTQWGHISMTAGDLYTVAGVNDQPGLGADGGLATSSDLKSPESIAVMPAGGPSNDSLFIPDAGNNRIQYVAAAGGVQWGQSRTAGDVYTIAGSSAGTSGVTGDGSAATSARLNNPLEVTLSTAGDLYIADSGNNRVQEVPAATGAQWTSSSMTQWDMYTVAGSATGVSGSGGSGVVATAEDLNNPTGLWSGNGQQLYIADYGNSTVQEVARTAHTEWGQAMVKDDIYTVAGTAGDFWQQGDGGPAAAAILDSPGDVALDGSNNLIIADTLNNEVRQVSASTAVISDLAGAGTFAQDGDGGPATTAGLYQPGYVTFDAAGDIFVADTGGNRVQEIAARSHTQFGITMTAGDVYTVAGQQGGYWGNGGDGGPATAAYLDEPEGVAVDSAGNLYIADTGNFEVQRVSASTGVISTFAGQATWDSGNSGDGGPATAATMEWPNALAVDAAGNVYITDGHANQLREVAAAGGTQWGQSMTAGDIYTVAGAVAGTAGHTGDGGPAGASWLSTPEGVSADPAGNLYIADGANNRIQEIAGPAHLQWGTQMTAGDIYTIAGSATGSAGNSGDGGPATAATLNSPEMMSLDSVGDLYIADGVNNRIREISAASGTQWGQSMTAAHIYNVAGVPAGTQGETGDGGPATSATLDFPTGLATDPAGDLFITDNGGYELREVTATTTSTLFGMYPQAGAVTVNQPGGSQVSFTPQSGGSCTAPYVTAGGYCTLPQNVGATLTYNSGTSSYTYSPAPGTSYTYGWNGALTGETDAAGNALTIAYGTPAPGTGNCPSTASTCETVTSASGRAMVIGSNANGLVTSVTDPLARRWTYGYTGSDLTSVTDPMSHVTTYTYGAGSTGNPLLANDLLTMTSPNAQPGGPDAGDATVNVYNAAGQVTSQTDPMGFATTFNYSALDVPTGSGVVRVADPDGNTTVYDYTLGALTAQSAWTGSTLVSEQDYGPDTTAGGTSGGTLLDTWTSNGDTQITSDTYDSAGNTTSTTDPLGDQTTETSTTLDNTSCDSTAQASSNCSSGPAPVAPGGVITPPSTAPPQGDTYTLYDTHGNELYSTTGVYQPGSSTASYLKTTYSLFTGNSVTLSGNTISCTTTPPSPSLPCATINADGVVTQLVYNSSGDLTSSAAPDGNSSEIAKTTYTYDGDGEQTATTSPDGNLSGANAGNYTTTTTYNADGEATTVTQAGGTGATAPPRPTTNGYDANGNKTTVQDARSYTTTTGNNADDKPTLVTDPLGNATLTCYDGDGNTTQTVPPAGVAAGSLTAASCPTSYPSGYGDRLATDATTYTFDANGNQTARTTPAPAGQTGYETTTSSYDAAGNLIGTIAPPASNSSGAPDNDTYNTYNADGQILTQTTGYGTSAASTTSYCYEPSGDRTAVVAPDGNTSGTATCETSSPWVVSSGAYPTQAAYQTTSSYDSADELLFTTSPATTAAPSGATTTYTYDPDANVLTSTDPAGVTTTRTYTPSGRVATISYSGSSAHAVSYTYDADGQRTAMTDATGPSSYVYDPFGEQTSAINGAGQAVSYGYNADGDTTGITYPLGSASWATTSTVSYGYDNANNLTSVTDFNGHQIAITPDDDGLPSAETLGSTGDTLSYTYDPTDFPSAITLKNTSATLESFTYSDAPAGNILAETDVPASSGSPADYGYDPQGRVTSMTPGTGTALDYGFDASGNLTTLPTGAAGTYDHDSDLTSSALSGTTTSYTYNADGQRLTSAQGSTTLTSATWNGAAELTSYDDSAADMAAASYNGDGLRASSTITPSGGTAVTQDYLWNGDSLLMDSANAYIYTSRTAPAEQVNLATGAITYLVTDSLGSVRGTVNTAGALTGSTSYDAWGNPRTSGGLTATTPFGYAGSYTDPDGLIYLVNRYYDPATGQFTSIDPEVRQTLQPYAYTTGDPVTETDPTGLAVNLKGAVAWAKANLNAGYNGFGDDCTDFVSRALHYGGGSPEKYGIRGEVWDDRFWWFVPGIYRSWSHSWSVAHDLAVHLVDIGSPYVKEANAQPGDVIFADWNADTFSLITHCAIITEMKNGTPLMDQHSPTQPNVSLTYWVRTGGKHVHWWIYRPNSG